jgi:hypothetical protein
MFPSARSAGLDVGRSGILRAVSGKNMVAIDGVPVSTKPKPYLKAKNAVWFNGLLVYSTGISEARTDKHQNGVLPCLKFGIIPVYAHDHCCTSRIMVIHTATRQSKNWPRPEMCRLSTEIEAARL